MNHRKTDKNKIMKTLEQLQTELKDQLSECNHVNDGSLAAQVNENIQWAWDNWDNKDLEEFYKGEKPENYTVQFKNHWIDCESFDMELEQINDPA